MQMPLMHEQVSTEEETEIINLAAFLAELDQDAALVEEIVTTYLIDARESIAGIHAAMATGDIEQAGRLVHSLKGASGNVRAGRMGAATRELELALQNGDPSGHAAWLELLEQSLVELEALLRRRLPAAIPS